MSDFIDIFNTDKKYSVIYADPPWRYSDSGAYSAAEKIYPTMSLEDICNLPVKNITEDNSLCFIWVTYPMLPNIFKVLTSWDFTYKTVAFTWIKTTDWTNTKFFFGTGHYTRANPEICILGVKGSPKILNHSIENLTLAPMTSHSEKPKLIYKKIVSLVGEDCTKLELFARNKFPGFDYFGNEIINEKMRLI